LPQTIDRMGVHVMITGSGCRQYETLYELKTLLLYLTILDDKVNFSRVDIAIDDLQNRIIDFGRIHRAAINGHFTSRWSKWDEVNSRQCSTGEFLGRTMYFGSQSSSIYCRIYDKTLERKAKSEEKTAESETWTRLEVVYKKERAKKLVYHIIDKDLSVGTAIRGTLKQYIRFIRPPRTSDINKARWPSAKWWEKLLDNVEKLQLTSRREPKSIDDMASWLDRQIAPTMAAIITAYEGDIEWLHEIIKNGASRLSQRHRDAIAQYLQEAQ
ncbi:replication initiation factor domain-containing protein, partial [Limosilactobacillus reuteri subsp. suis]